MQIPDSKPGHYYVTAKLGNKTAFLAGPFTTRYPDTLPHRKALSIVGHCKHLTAEKFRLTDTTWAVYGTSRLPLCVDPPVGKLNALGLIP